MRAKYRCNSVKFYGDPTDPNTLREYELSAVYDTRTEENRRFAKATPYGQLTQRVDNPNAHLEVGEDYYLDFTPTFLATAERTPETMGNVHGERTPYTEPYKPHAGLAAGNDPHAIREGGRHAAVHGGYPDPAPTEAPSSKGYSGITTTPDLATHTPVEVHKDLTATQPMDPAEITAGYAGPDTVTEKPEYQASER